MDTLIALVLTVLILVLLIQGRSSHSKIDKSLKLTSDIHKEIMSNKKVAGEVVDKHVAINKEEGGKLREAVKQSENR